jgi:hypothetical protein
MKIIKNEQNKPRRENNMKQFINMMCFLTLLSSLVFSENSRVLKSEFKKIE